MSKFLVFYSIFGSGYANTLSFVEAIADAKPDIFNHNILQVMDDMRSALVDFIVLGQYLRPTKSHAKVVRYVPPKEFDYYEVQAKAKAKGFLMVSSSPLARSSFHAAEDFKKLL